MPQSNFVNTNAETILDTYTKVELSLDANSPAPAGNYLARVEFVGTPTNAPTSLTWWLTYDSAGQDPAYGPLTTNIGTVPGGTLAGATAKVDDWLAPNRTGRVAPLYLWAKTDAVTKTLALGALTGCVVVLRDSRC